ALLDYRGGRVFATPSYPGLRLYSDSLGETLGATSVLRPVAAYSDKHRVIEIELPSEQPTCHPLAAICLLEQPREDEPDISFRPMAPAEACMAISEKSFRLAPSDHRQAFQQLGLVAEVAEALPAYRLSSPPDFNLKGALIGRLIEQFDAISRESA